MEASDSSCAFAATRETISPEQDPDPHPARGLGAICWMNLPGVTLA